MTYKELVEYLERSLNEWYRDGFIPGGFKEICIADIIWDCEFIKQRYDVYGTEIKKYYRHQNIYFSTELLSNSWCDGPVRYKVFDLIKSIKEEKFVRMVPLFESEG